MIIQLDWFGCDPRTNWEALIHQALEHFATLKTIERAQVRIEQFSQNTLPYKLSVILSIPGPDVQAQASGHTFDEALLKLTSSVRKTLNLRAMKVRKSDAALLGVKALHRG